MKLRRITSLVAAMFACAALATGVARASGCATTEVGGGDWIARGGALNGQRNQAAEHEIGPAQAAGLTVAWTVPGSGISGTPIVAGGCVYFVSSGTVVKVNADDGSLVWHTANIKAGASVTYDNGRIFANVNDDTGVGMVAIEDADGSIAWTKHIDEQYLVTVNGSPVAFDGMVLTGIAAGGQEIENGPQRTIMRGAYAFFRQSDGELLHKGYTIPDADFTQGYAGGGLWSTPAVDPATGYAYFGTGNPYSAREHANTNAMIKVDANPERASFGQIVATYKGISDLYLAQGTYKPACQQTNTIVPCEPLDVDFGGSPALWTDAAGRRFVGDLQKAGVFHVANADTMGGIWAATISYPATFGNAGTAAVDGDGVYVTAQFGTMWGLRAGTGDIAWAFPTGGNGWATANSVANGVVYEADNGVLRALDTATGLPVLVHPMQGDVGGSTAGANVAAAFSGLDAGVAIARHTIYVNASAAIVAYRPA